MITDAATIPRDSVLTPDVAIIGAGAAGITLARALRDTSISVLLLESGRFRETQATADLMTGFSTGPEPYDLNFARLRFFGGTTNHWGGWCRPMDDWVLAGRSWLPDSAWPMSLADLDPYYARANEIVQMPVDPPGWRWPWPYWRQEFAGNPKTEIFVDDAVMTGAAFRLSPPTRFGEVYRQDLEQAANVEVILDANAVRLDTDPSATRVTEIPVRSLAGNRFSVRAGVVVVATGGLDVARILLASNRVRERGLGNDHGLVGRYFMDHLESYVGTAEIAPPSEPYRTGFIGNVKIALTLTLEAMARDELLGLGVLLSESPSDTGVAADRRTGVRPRDVVGLTRRIDGGAPRRVFALEVRGEPRPDPDSRVTLSRERDAIGMPRIDLSYSIAQTSRASMARTLELMGRHLGRLSLGRVRINVEDFADSNFEFTPGWHLMGTTRMHTDPRKGVVDGDLRVHGLENLYVASSSVFPSVGISNPTLTIVALALRLGEHLDRVVRA